MSRTIDPSEQHRRREEASRPAERVVTVDVSRAPGLAAALGIKPCRECGRPAEWVITTMSGALPVCADDARFYLDKGPDIYPAELLGYGVSR